MKAELKADNAPLNIMEYIIDSGISDTHGIGDIEVAITINELSYYADELDDQLKDSFAS